MEIILQPLCHGAVGDDLATGALHEDIAQNGAIDAKTHERTKHVSMADETIAIIPSDRQQSHAEIDGPIVIIPSKGDAHPLRLVVAAFSFRRDSLHMGRDGLTDLRRKRRHERPYRKRPAPVHRVRQVQKPHGHLLGLITGGRKITENLFSIFHKFLNLNKKV